MHFSKELYLSDSLIKKKRKICRKIKSGKYSGGAYLIYNNFFNNNLEFMKASYFKQDFYRHLPIEILGIAENYSDAIMELAKRTCKDNNIIFDE